MAIAAIGWWRVPKRAATLSDEGLDVVIAESQRGQVAAGVTTLRDLGDLGYRTLGFRERPGLPRVVAAGATADHRRRALPLPRRGRRRRPGRGGRRARAARGRRDQGDGLGGFATEGTDHLGAQFSVAELRIMVDRAHAAGLPVVAYAPTGWSASRTHRRPASTASSTSAVSPPTVWGSTTTCWTRWPAGGCGSV